MEIKYLNFLSPYKFKIGDTKGITLDEILYIESIFSIKLPNAYKEYLLLFGKESGNLLSSYYTEYPSVLENKEDAIYALNFDDRQLNKDKPKLKNSYFFFGQWQGYVFYFFDCEEDCKNPPVYILTDAPKIEKYKDSFSEFIRDEGLKPLLGL